MLLAAQLGTWFLGASFLPIEVEFQRVMLVASVVMMGMLIAVSCYLAFEPIVRRRWPWGPIAWNRLMTHGIRDPLVGRDVLIGAVPSIAGTALYQLLLLTDVGLRGDRLPTAASRS